MIGYVTINVTLFLTNYILEVNFMKRILSLFAAFAVMLSLSACQLNDTGQDMQSSAVIEQTNETTEMKTIEPPEDGWTLEELNQVLYLNGQQIQLPLMFSSLNDGYEIRNRKYNDKDSLDYNIVGGELYYNNELLAVVSFYELSNDLEIISLFMLPILYTDTQNTTEYIHINGFGLKSNISDIHNTLGNGYIYESERFIYNIKNSNFSISIPNIEEDFSIIIKTNKNEFT